MSTDPGLSIEALADRAGVSVRTVRYYISQGLLPGPANRGKYASYDVDHLARLQLIRRLVDQRVPLADLRERLVHLTPDEVRTLLREEDRRSRALEQTRKTASPREYVSGLLARARAAPAPAPPPSQHPPVQPLLAPASPALRAAKPAPQSSILQPELVQRWELAPGVELLVRPEAARQHAHLIERLLESARDEASRNSR